MRAKINLNAMSFQSLRIHRKEKLVVVALELSREIHKVFAGGTVLVFSQS